MQVDKQCPCGGWNHRLQHCAALEKETKKPETNRIKIVPVNTTKVRVGTVRTGNEKSEKQTCVWDLRGQREVEDIKKWQSHSSVEVGRDLRRPLLKQDHLEPVVQNCGQLAFKYLQGEQLCKLPGQAVPVLRHPHSKPALTDVHREPPVFQFVPNASCPVTTGKSLAVLFWHPPFRDLEIKK